MNGGIGSWGYDRLPTFSQWEQLKHPQSSTYLPETCRTNHEEAPTSWPAMNCGSATHDLLYAVSSAVQWHLTTARRLTPHRYGGAEGFSHVKIVSLPHIVYCHSLSSHRLIIEPFDPITILWHWIMLLYLRTLCWIHFERRVFSNLGSTVWVINITNQACLCPTSSDRVLKKRNYALISGEELISSGKGASTRSLP